jgi:hypothetical protein
MKKLIIILIIMNSCEKVNCDLIKQSVKKNECLIVVKKLPDGPYFEAKGKNLSTQKEAYCFDGERWWTQYARYVEIGDTIIKKKGELIFSIHKKDTVLSFPWECEGKVYK